MRGREDLSWIPHVSIINFILGQQFWNDKGTQKPIRHEKKSCPNITTEKNSYSLLLQKIQQFYRHHQTRSADNFGLPLVEVPKWWKKDPTNGPVSNPQPIKYCRKKKCLNIIIKSMRQAEFLAQIFMVKRFPNRDHGIRFPSRFTIGLGFTVFEGWSIFEVPGCWAAEIVLGRL